MIRRIIMKGCDLKRIMRALLAIETLRLSTYHDNQRRQQKSSEVGVLGGSKFRTQV